MDGLSIVIGLVTPVVSGFIVQSYVRGNTRRDAYRQAFCKLHGDVRMLQREFIKNMYFTNDWNRLDQGVESQRTQYEKNLPNAEPGQIERMKAGLYEINLKYEEHQEKSPAVLEALRQAITEVEGDMLVIDMLFDREARALKEAARQLLEACLLFEPLEHGGRIPEYEQYRSIDHKQLVRKIDTEIQQLWKSKGAEDLF